MSQASSTRLQLNSLVDFYFPIASKNLKLICTVEKKKKAEIDLEIEIDMPCTILAQKIQIEVEEMFIEDFAKVFIIDKVRHSNNDDSFQESIMIKNRIAGQGVEKLVIEEEQVSKEDDVMGQSLKLCCVGGKFQVAIKVKEDFGFDLHNSNICEKEQEKIDPETQSSLKREQIKEDLRSISRTMIEQQTSETKANRQINKNEAEEIITRALMSIVKGFRVLGWPCFRIPPANALIPLMNTSFLLGSKGLQDQRRDIDFLVGLSLISGRKFIQACEIFRRLEADMYLSSNNSYVIEKAIQLEILIADSLNQHSQLIEKINAFQRAVDLSLNKKIVLQTKFQNHLQINDDLAHKVLMKLHPQLIKILLQNINSKVEALQMAVLRNIEFLVDQLGCSLDQYLIHILASVIKSYPRSNYHQQQSTISIQRFQIPKRQGFFQENNLLGGVSDLRYDRVYENSYINSIIFEINDPSNLTVKDGQSIQTSYVSSIKNLQNHILESFIQLLSSMSSGILQQIFHDVIIKCVFLQNGNTNPFEGQLATDLRIYLLKFLDKIVTICQGDLILNPHFLNNIVECIYPSLPNQVEPIKKSTQLGGNSLLSSTASNNSTINDPSSNLAPGLGAKEVVKIKQKVNQTISLACSNLWQTFRSRLFNSYSTKGLKVLVEWISSVLQALSTDTESKQNVTITQDQNQKLILIFDLIEVITENSSRPPLSIVETKTDEDPINRDCGTIIRQSLSSRDTKRVPIPNKNVNKNSDNNNIIIIDNQDHKSRRHRSQITLELFSLINPMLFWLNYSLEKPERLPLFKSLWKSLSKLVTQLPSKHIDLTTIILPALQRVNDFCLTSSPSLEMLQFLNIVFSDFLLQTNPLPSLLSFLSKFLVTLAKCIPHHLNEEIFHVTESTLELLLTLPNEIRTSHIQSIIEALTDKFTMRSKAHKRLTKYFLQRVIIQESQNQLRQMQKKERLIIDEQVFEQNNFREENNQIVGSQQQQQQRNNNNGGGRQERGRGHNNNDLGLVVNQEDIELNRDFQMQQYESSALEGEGEDDDDEEVFEDEEGGGAGNEGMASEGQDFEEVEAEVGSNHLLSHNNQLNLIGGIGDQLPQLDHENFPPSDQFSSRHNFEPPAQLIDFQTNLDIFIDICFINLEQKSGTDKHMEIVEMEKFQEKLELFTALLKLFNKEDQVELFKIIIRKDEEIIRAVFKIFTDGSELLLTANRAIEIVELLTKYFMQYCNTKNVYEYPLSVLIRAKEYVMHGDEINPVHHNNQHSQSSGQQQQQHQQLHQYNQQNLINNSYQSTRNNPHSLQNNRITGSLGPGPSYFSSSHPILFHTNGPNQLNLMRSTIHSQQVQHHQQQQQQHFNQRRFNNMIDDDFIIGTDIDQIHMEEVCDEVEVINREKLILIKLHTRLIRVALDRKDCDVHLQFYALNLIDNLFANLMPAPNLLNLIMKGGQKPPGQVQQRQRIMSQSINHSSDSGELGNHGNSESRNFAYFDVEKQVIIERQNNHRSANQRYNNQSSRQLSFQQPAQESLSRMPNEFECSDQLYLEGRLHYAIKIWRFIEESLIKSSWSTIKSVAYGSLCQMLKGAAITLKTSKDKNILKLKQILIPLLNLLLESKESEAKAGGLNLLGSISGLGIDLGIPSDSNQIQIKEYLPLLRSDSQNPQAVLQGGSRLISASLWQRVFQLSEEDWDPTIRDAATVLIQVCAPRQQIMQFQTIAQERYQSKVLKIVSQLNIQQRRDSCSSEESKDVSSDNSRYSEEIKNQNEREQIIGEKEYFFIDSYNESQLRELFVIFKNDYKPPAKNLWVEKNGSTFNLDGKKFSTHLQLGDQGTSSNLVDIFEDRIVDRLNTLYSQQQSDSQHIDQASAISTVFDQCFFSKTKLQQTNLHNGESEYLIFERHFDDKKSDLLKDSPQQPQIEATSHEEDLGIIDLDELEGGGNGESADQLAFFDDQFDDDKLPVLKNTYSKKHRPNNSKSVAVGSRTQNMLVMTTSSNNQAVQNQAEVNLEREENAIQDKDNGSNTQLASAGLILQSNKDLILDQMALKDEEIKGTGTEQDKIIEEYEQRIALSIATLNTELKKEVNIDSTNLNIEEFKISPQKDFKDGIDKQSLRINEPKIVVNVSPTRVLKSRTPKEDHLLVKYSSEQNTYKVMNKSLEGKQQFSQGPKRKQSDNIETQNINISIIPQPNAVLKKVGQNQSMLQKALGTSDEQHKVLNKKHSYQQSHTNKLKTSSQLTKGIAKSSAIPVPVVGTHGPLVNAISSAQSRKTLQKFNYKNAGVNSMTSNHSYKHLGLLQNDTQNQNQFNTVASSFAANVKKHKINKGIIPSTTSNNTLMNQAKEVAMVSRAKSQSYLNSVSSPKNNNAQPPTANTPLTSGMIVDGVLVANFFQHAKTSAKKKGSFKNSSRPRGSSGGNNKSLGQIKSTQPMIFESIGSYNTINFQPKTTKSIFKAPQFPVKLDNFLEQEDRVPSRHSHSMHAQLIPNDDDEFQEGNINETDEAHAIIDNKDEDSDNDNDEDLEEFIKLDDGEDSIEFQVKEKQIAKKQ